MNVESVFVLVIVVSLLCERLIEFYLACVLRILFNLLCESEIAPFVLWEYVRKRKISYRFDILDKLTVTSRSLNFSVTRKNLLEIGQRNFG